MIQLTPESIESVLRTRRLGHPALVFDRIGSTNDVAQQQARAGARDGLLVVAEEQTAGRGRLDRTWWAPPGSCLLMSLLIAPGTVGRTLPLHLSGQLTMCVGLGAVEAIAKVTGVSARLKWPNDVLVGGRKLGGMLTELNTGEDRLNYAVMGLGLNVNVDFVAEGAPPELIPLATSLLAGTGQPVDRLALLAAILEQTERWYERVLDGESPHATWAQRLDTLGRRVRVSFVSGLLEGTAVGVTAEGGLLVEDRTGSIHTVWSGDVTALR
jgi:BirA family transcriptional regulator, biotin operon repressor / biotin---[acetyl-CoA-carboxylase] ligase